ncbi:esterase/lipase family protein [Treponema sp. R80B11-R83G3]
MSFVWLSISNNMKNFIIVITLLLFFSCKTITTVEDVKNNIPLKYPVVLVHGIYANDREKVEKFWGRIPKTLEDNGIKVFFGNTDAWGDYESNAEILHNTIENILRETNSEKVNIIAHSKGGLDSRYCIWKYNYGDKVASLTTVSTPHHGAELADLIFDQKIIHTKMIKEALKIYGELYGDTNPDLYSVNYQLTTDYMKKFNEEVIIDKRVYYQSIYSVMESPHDDVMFYYSNRYIKKINGDNDGVVSEHSAKWSDNITKIAGGISHTDIIDQNKKKGINIPAIYIKIVNDLCEKGF